MVKIIDFLKLEGRGVEIPDASRDDLPQFYLDRGGGIGAEIGVDEGMFSEKLAQAGLTVYSIDPWLDYPDFHKKGMQRQLNGRYQNAVNRLAPYKYCMILRKTSMQALDYVPDGSLDFVYIDGHHGFKYVAEDLCDWVKKVKKGGIISGHDYMVMKSAPYAPYACHVKYIVDAFTMAFDIRNWYILGKRFPPEGGTRDKARSWFWINTYE